MHMKHSCRQVSQLVSDAHERPLSLAEKFRLRLHMIMCAPCKNYEKDIFLISGILKRFQTKGSDEDIGLSKQGFKRIQQALRKASE